LTEKAGELSSTVSPYCKEKEKEEVKEVPEEAVMRPFWAI
jgi:hypothetical protein